jgi:hypothetical protein
MLIDQRMVFAADFAKTGRTSARTLAISGAGELACSKNLNV